MPLSLTRRRGRLLGGGLAILAVPCVVAIHPIRDGAVGILESPVRPPRVLGPGLHVRLRGAERILDGSPFPYASSVRFHTPEGSALEVQVGVPIWLSREGTEAELRAPAAGRVPAGRRLVAAFDQAVASVLTDAALTSRLPDPGPALRGRITRALAGFGRPGDDLTLRYVDTDDTAQALEQAESRDAIRRAAQDTGLKILLVGLDGADWQIADPLIRAGRLPNLARLKAQGAWGSIRSLQPALSPLLWTSLATGTTPDRHGITDFLVRDPDSGRLVPVSSNRRRQPAFWNHFTTAGRSVDVVAWWATWPAERINGHMVSDRVSYSLFDFDIPADGSGTTYPPEYFGEIRSRLVSARQITQADLDIFVDADGGAGRGPQPGGRSKEAAHFRDPVEHLANILASTRSYHAIALDLISRGQPDLLAVYYQAIDEVCHRFMHFTTPALPGIDREAVRRFGRAVERIYEYQDRLLGEIVAAVDPETVVIVVSDHGFVNGPDRPVGQTADIEGQPGRWHRPFGILVLSGKAVAPGRMETASLMDILPTTLYLAGLPVPEDIRGRPLSEQIVPQFRNRFPLRTIATYQSGGFVPDTGPVTATMAAVEETFVEKLRSLGYIGEAGPGSGDAPPVASREGPETTVGRVPSPGAASDTVTAHTNLAAVYLTEGDLREAEREIMAALAMTPDFQPARHQLVELRTRQGRYAEAIDAAEILLRAGGGASPLFLNRLAEIYLLADRAADGTSRFRTAYQAGHWLYGVGLARMQIETGDAAGAIRTAEAVLDHDPLNEPSMAVLFRALMADHRAGETEARLDRALKMNRRAVMFLNWKAILLEERGEQAPAEALLRSALEHHPDHGRSAANLGAFRLRRGRPGEALPALERAVVLDPGNLEARVNLGTALAMTGRMNDAILAYEEAARRGVKTTDLFNALARAHHERGNDAAAAGWIRKSLELDAGQVEVRQALDRLAPRR